MISINKKRLLRQLEQKKRRDAEGLFVAEGRKTVGDLLRGGLRATYIAGTAERIAEVATLAPATETVVCTSEELAEVSALKTRAELIAIFRKPENDVAAIGRDELVLALDEVQDPGNLGTILRTADWFGVRRVVCSNLCADAYGPKAVQATMGALARVGVTYTDLGRWLASLPADVQVFGAYLEGENIYGAGLPRGGVILMGNEGHGISEKLERYVGRKVNIPSYPAGEATSESLNVSIATSVILSEFRRRLFLIDR